MRISRLYINAPLRSGNTVELDAERLNYVARVLRMKPGYDITVFNGEGGEYHATITELHKRRGVIEIGDYRDIDVESTLHISLVQGIARGERMDLVLQKSTELGVSRIIPVFSERCNVSLNGERLEKREQHWRGVIQSACEQCGRNRLPVLEPAVSLAHFLANDDTTATRLLLDPVASNSLGQLSPGHDITLLIGPEGGFSPAEREQAYACDFEGIALGPRVLRTETAALGAISALQALYGDFSGA